MAEQVRIKRDKEKMEWKIGEDITTLSILNLNILIATPSRESALIVYETTLEVERKITTVIYENDAMALPYWLHLPRLEDDKLVVVPQCK